MEGKITCNIAISMDGFIADENDGYDWIEGQHDHTLDSEHTYSFESFLEEIDIVIMGRRCYDLKMHEQFQEKEVLIFTSNAYESNESVRFVTSMHSQVLIDLKKQGKQIYVFGGGVLVSKLLKLNLINELILGIIPKLLGSGIPLFHPGYPPQSFKLNGTKIEDGIVILMYKRILNNDL
jgi:dihydrofolate reductase